MWLAYSVLEEVGWRSSTRSEGFKLRPRPDEALADVGAEAETEKSGGAAVRGRFCVVEAAAAGLTSSEVRRFFPVGGASRSV